VLSAALVVWMAGGLQSAKSFDIAPFGRADAPASRETLTVVVWNIAWGFGWGSEGNGRAKPAQHFRESVAKIGEQLAALDADLALLQEVDFSATRSGLFDQAELIAARAQLPYVAHAPSWTANWVPFPYWPPREHFGRMRSGGAILSRYPITTNSVRLLEKPPEYAWWYKLFYPFRYLQRCTVRVGELDILVWNTHLEAFKEKNRVEQATEVKKLLQEMSPEIRAAVIFGGDLNAVPQEATQKTNYPDETDVVTAHDQDTTVEIFRAIPGLNDVFPAEKYSADERSYFTFPAHAPNRKLDHLFLGERFEVVEARVAHEAGAVSDHLPLLVKLRLRAR
jgi:endonuclease/exonuclease/phosphatase family metal-dependent hydrolase